MDVCHKMSDKGGYISIIRLTLYNLIKLLCTNWRSLLSVIVDILVTFHHSQVASELTNMFKLLIPFVL